MHSDSTSEPRGSRSPAPWFLMLAIVLLVVAGVTTLLRSRVTPHNLPPSIDDPAQPIDALRAELPLDAGGRLIAELTALYTDPAHAEFESNSLRRRLELGEGQPWRLRLRWDAPAGTGGSVGSVGSDLKPGALEAIALGPLELFEAAELVSRTLEFQPANDGPRDPVQTLFAAPKGSFGPGEAVDLVVWGRGVRGRAQLRGLLLGGEALALDFEPTTLARADLELPLTHEVRGDETVRTGKNSATNASQRSARPRAASDG